jgi:hypothetical protein
MPIFAARVSMSGTSILLISEELESDINLTSLRNYGLVEVPEGSLRMQSREGSFTRPKTVFTR